MKSPSREKVRERLNAAKVNFRLSNLEGLDLSGLDLTGADFRFSDLSHVNFSNSILRNADLSFSDIDDANFENADLTNANLRFSSLERANLTNAQMTDADFSFTGKGQNPINRFASLTHFLYRTGWFGTIIGILIGTFIFYGVSGIVYFTNQILTAEEPAFRNFNQYIVINNVIGGISTVVITNWLSGPLERWFKSSLVQHAVLSVIIFFEYMAQTTLAFFQYGRFLIEELIKKYPDQSTNNAVWYVYALSPLFVANVFHYFQKQGNQLTRKITEQEFQLVDLEKLKTKAELDALQAKINPHFLYNSLNSIASLVHLDPDKAEQMTLLMSKLFRYVTNKTADYYDTLANELEMVATYLEIEQVRFGDRLSFRIIVKDEALKNAQIPRFLIQPIVENAIKHGIAKIADRGIVEIRITQDRDLLKIAVHDNGPLFPEPINGGYGLQSIQHKLRLLYGEKANLSLQNAPLKQVLIDLPFEAGVSKS
ncbi:histidine kinase [Runella sp.]|jgi:sensor histidine kinase YesM|uniref:histidine kinase n=1 Tax=Runella sp. TaxID=1960881 RepID=UPI0026357210|nr:histidine kinase [Runella sp.]